MSTTELSSSDLCDLLRYL